MSSAKNNELPHLTGSKLVFGTLALSAANFMVILDMTVANVSVPTIAGNLGVSTSQGTWVITSYAIAEAITVPLTGWLAQRLGTVRLMVACIGLFALTSLACGLSPTLGSLVAMRVLQGVSGGPVMPLSQVLLLAAYPRERANQATVMWSLAVMLAPIFGPVLGGTISDGLSWHWIFYVNVPVGIVCGFCVYSLFRERDTPRRRVPVDVVGLGLLVAAVGCFQIVLDKGKELDWFESDFIVTLSSVSAVSLVVLIVWELTDEHPIVDLRLFNSRNFTIGAVGTSMFFGLVFGFMVIIPLWMQTQMGYTASLAGLAVAPHGLGAMTSALLLSRLTGRLDPRKLVSLGTCFLITSLLIRTRFTTDVDWGTLLIPQFIQGLSTPFFFLPLIGVSMSDVPPHKIASAAGLQNFMRTAGGAFGASLATTIWDNLAAEHRVDLVAHISEGGMATQLWQSTLRNQGMGTEQIALYMDRVLQGQAVMLATNDFFRGIGLLSLFVTALVWFTRPRKQARAGAASDAVEAAMH